MKYYVHAAWLAWMQPALHACRWFLNFKSYISRTSRKENIHLGLESQLKIVSWIIETAQPSQPNDIIDFWEFPDLIFSACYTGSSLIMFSSEPEGKHIGS